MSDPSTNNLKFDHSFDLQTLIFAIHLETNEKNYWSLML